jgi:error-prone DNA polymerase
MVLLRQRPGSAKGITFMTLEDETGQANLVVYPDVWDRFRRVARMSSAMLVAGRVQRDTAGTTHLVAMRLADLSETVSVAVRARDFQ